MREKIFDDMNGLVGGALGILSDIREQMRGDIHDRLRMAADRIDLATREDVARLEARVAALEALLTPPPARAPKAAKKPAAKKSKK